MGFLGKYGYTKKNMVNCLCIRFLAEIQFGRKTMTRRYRFAVLFSALAFLITFGLFYYMDLKSLTIWTVNVWDTLAETGNLYNFYEYSAGNVHGLAHAMVGSDILIYLPWAIWNLPIWALQRFGGFMIVNNAWMLFYSKLFLLAVFAVVLFLTKRIAGLLTEEKESVDRTLFLSATSFFTVTAIAYIGQNDVLVIAPFLAGIYELLKGNKRRFVLWAALSIAFKPFFVFSYVALILLYEKNLLKAGLMSLGGFGLFVLQKLLFLGAPLYSESLSYGPTNGAIKLLVQSVLDIPPAGASLFFLGLGIVWLLAYFRQGEEKQKEYTLYFAVAPLVMLFLFTRYESYRPFYLVPLLYLLMLTKPAYSRINLLLETVATGSLMYFYMMDDILFYSPKYLLIPKGEVPSPTISEWLLARLPGYGFQITTAIFVLAMGMILVINHPAFRSENQVLKRKEEPWLVFVRTALYAMPMVFAVILRVVY